MALRRGDEIPADCGPDGKIGNLIIQKVTGDDNILGTNNTKKGKLIKGSTADDNIDPDICPSAPWDPQRVDFLAHQRNRILRMYVNAPPLAPTCRLLGLAGYMTDQLTGTITTRFPLNYSAFNPNGSGGAGWFGYNFWGLVRGNGGVHGNCATGLGICGSIDLDSTGANAILLTGSVIGGTITGFPSSGSFTDSGVGFSALLTGCCVDSYTGAPPVIISVSYNICMYAEAP